MTRYIFVTGGVVSSLGKGIISASIGNYEFYQRDSMKEVRSQKLEVWI